MTKLKTSYLIALFAAISFLSSCELAKGLFKAGYYVGIIVVVVILIVIFWIVSAFRKKG
ncbi:phosphatidate cytidylyltransferase [Pedobacter sp. HMF7647]|uniref:Phosphatidate cytidylyltransferase n=1 Tax=Hufsiella arboris TaxID=2695275 RepID=A0A7K1Y5Z5_9SPHI|nr:phosphatidate cytidylyltransferase [Hufsiella arboris]MXV49995.1 phosphatidate cytidylyltransferase [Hufsiella arboris]